MKIVLKMQKMIIKIIYIQSYKVILIFLIDSMRKAHKKSSDIADNRSIFK